MKKSSENEGRAMGKGQFANMPQEVTMKAYPKANEFGPGVLDDTITGIDAATKKAHTKSHKYLSNQH
jgi:hypothetical protein